MRFKQFNGMDRIVTALCLNVTLLLILNVQLQNVSSAPVSLSSPSFYDKLYQAQNCSLPKVSQENQNYTISKINQLCGSIVEESSLNVTKEKAGQQVNLCNSLVVVFSTLCKSPNSSKGVNISTDSPVVDLIKSGSIGIKKVCENLEQAGRNISQISEGVIISPFSSQLPDERGESLCLSACKNSRDIREGFNEYSKLEVHPVCILLMNGYSMYQQIVVRSHSASNATLSSKTAKISEALNNAQSAKIVQDVSLDGVSSTEPKSKIINNSLPNPAVDAQNVKVGDSDKSINVDATDKSNNDSNSKSPSVTVKNVELTSQIKLPNIKNENVSVKSASKSETLTDLPDKSDTEELQFVDLKKADEGLLKSVINEKITTSTSTTVASLDGVNDEPLLPVGNEQLKSSTPIVKTSSGKSINPKENDKDTKVDSAVGSEAVDKDKADPVVPPAMKLPVQKQSKPAKKNEEADMMAELGADDDSTDYNPGEDLDTGIMKPPSKLTDDDKEVEIPQPEIENRGYDAESTLKAKNRFSGNSFREDIDFSRGTTINVSLKESEDTGFFNYFLFSVTLVGLMYLVIHNKKKLIAFVVEGKRPRSRTRRSSSSSQYRRLENNFD